MRRFFLSITILTAAGYMLAACQSGEYRIEGVTDALQDGDTLFVTDDLQWGTPKDTLIVKDGKFGTEGKADSTYLCMVYSAKRHDINMPFFIEQGTIKINLARDRRQAKVGGTPVNNKWQEMNDSATAIGQQMNSIAEYVHRNNLSKEELQHEIDKSVELHNRFRGLVTEYARKNTDNEFGYFLLTYYDDVNGFGIYDENGLIGIDTRLELIEKMPRNMQERPAVKALKEKLNRAKALAEGNRITDFEMNDINGKPLKIMTEIGKNKITVIDFWASWCGPCRNEMPRMVALYDKYNAKGLGIIGISLDKDKADWERATKQLGIKWPQMSDLQGWNNAAARMFNVRAIPQVIVVDRQGVILKKGLRGEELEEFVADKLK